MRDSTRRQPDSAGDTGRKDSAVREVPLVASEPGAAPWRLNWPWIAAAGTLLGVFTWAYWPTLVSLVEAWDREPDYSHGILVVPLAICFLWFRRSDFPGFAPRLAWLGLGVVALSIVARVLGAWVYLDAADGWSILLWVAGVVWFLAGWRVLRWSMPSIVFLWFMVPLPFRVERGLSLPLQGIATKASCWVLQCFGQPALAEGNTLLLDDFHMEIENACSGLRIFMGVVALAFAYVILMRRTWWERALLLAATVPAALIANITRIVVTGLLYRYVSGEAAQRFTHDAAGMVMIPFAAALFALFLWYLGRLVPEVEQVGVESLVRREQAGHLPSSSSRP